VYVLYLGYQYNKEIYKFHPIDPIFNIQLNCAWFYGNANGLKVAYQWNNKLLLNLFKDTK